MLLGEEFTDTFWYSNPVDSSFTKFFPTCDSTEKPISNGAYADMYALFWKLVVNPRMLIVSTGLGTRLSLFLFPIPDPQRGPASRFNPKPPPPLLVLL